MFTSMPLMRRWSLTVSAGAPTLMKALQHLKAHLSLIVPEFAVVEEGYLHSNEVLPYAPAPAGCHVEVIRLEPYVIKEAESPPDPYEIFVAIPQGGQLPPELRTIKGGLPGAARWSEIWQAIAPYRSNLEGFWIWVPPRPEEDLNEEGKWELFVECVETHARTEDEDD